MQKIKSKLKIKIYLILSILFIIFSCEESGQITGTVASPSQDVYVSTDLGGNGISAGSLADLYFNFVKEDSYHQEYWKFERKHFTGITHCGPDSDCGYYDKLTLDTYNDLFYIPSSSFVICTSLEELECIDNNDICDATYVLVVDPETSEESEEFSGCASKNLNYNFYEYVDCSVYVIENECEINSVCEFDDNSSECKVIDCHQFSNSNDCLAHSNVCNEVLDLGDNSFSECANIFSDEQSANYYPNFIDGLSTIPEENDSTKTQDYDSELSLTSSTFYVIDQLDWQFTLGRFDAITSLADKDTLTFSVSYEYDSLYKSVVVDEVLNPINDAHLAIIDPNELVFRNYTIDDTYISTDQNGENPTTETTTIKRENVFKIKETVLPNDGVVYRQTTDCNDNYQKDDAEFMQSDCGVFSVNNSDLCASLCDGNSMYDTCWELYENEARLTGHCAVSNGEVFCDTGNNLYDGPEILYDYCEGDCDFDGNDIDVIGQGTEPYEDRDCNGVYDSLGEEDIDDVDESGCNDIDYASWDVDKSICFYDSGNNQWDDAETCYGGADQCFYYDMFKRVDTPNIFLTTYADQDNPIQLASIFADDRWEDCGIDDNGQPTNCNPREDGFDFGTCKDGYSGSKDDCCKHNNCWNYITELCDVSLQDCAYDIIENYDGNNDQSYLWNQNLDPEGDDYICNDLEENYECMRYGYVYNEDTETYDVACQEYEYTCNNPNGGTEGNGKYDIGELMTSDLNLDGIFSYADTLVTKRLNYPESECSEYNCGGHVFDILIDQIREVPSISVENKIKSHNKLYSNHVVSQIPTNNQNVSQYLNDMNIVKTKWPNDESSEDYDYMLFIDSDDQDSQGMHYIIKLIKPYFYYANTPMSYGNSLLDDYNDYSLDNWWQSLSIERDTMIYSSSGQLLDGQTYYSNQYVDSENGNYNVHKEYWVRLHQDQNPDERIVVDTEYNGTITGEWSSDGPDGVPIKPIVLVRRIITTTMIGTGVDFKLRSDTYLKDDDNFGPIIKENIFISWPPALGASETWIPISSIESVGNSNTLMRENNNLFSNPEPIKLEEFQNIPELDFDPFRFTKTIGLQRFNIQDISQ